LQRGRLGIGGTQCCLVGSFNKIQNLFCLSPNEKNGKETWLQMPIPALGLQKKTYGSVLVGNRACDSKVMG